MSGRVQYLFNHCGHNACSRDDGDMYSPESNRQGLEDTAGDRAGLVVGGVLLGGTAVVGGAAVAVNALFLTETGSLVLWTGGTGQTAAGFGSTLSSTTGGKFLEALSSMGVKVPEAVWRQASTYLSANASGVVRVTIPTGGSVGPILRTELQVLQQNPRVMDIAVRVVRPGK